MSLSFFYFGRRLPSSTCYFVSLSSAVYCLPFSCLEAVLSQPAVCLAAWSCRVLPTLYFVVDEG